jgi:predicted acyltransferase (DUF342 family)
MRGIAGWFEVRGSRFKVQGSRFEVQDSKFTVHGKRLADIVPGDERGHALLVVLILLLVGGLVIGPLLGFVSTGLTAGPVFEEKTLQLYAADAGAKLGQWHLLHGGLAVAAGEMRRLPEFRLNNNGVNVTITRPDADLIFEITSTATTPGGSSTTIKSRVKATFVPPPPCVAVYDHHELSGPGLEIYGDVVVHTTVDLQQDSSIEGNLTAGGDVTLDESYIEGNVHTGGNVSLKYHSYIEGNVTASGAISLKQDSYIEGNLIAGGDVSLKYHSYIEGNVTASGAISLKQDSYIEGNVTASGAISLKHDSYIEGNVAASGAITLEQESYIEGNVYVCHSLHMDGKSRIDGNVYVSCPEQLDHIEKNYADRIEGDIKYWHNGCLLFADPTAVLTLFWVIS